MLTDCSSSIQADRGGLLAMTIIGRKQNMIFNVSYLSTLISSLFAHSLCRHCKVIGTGGFNSTARHRGIHQSVTVLSPNTLQHCWRSRPPGGSRCR